MTRFFIRKVSTLALLCSLSSISLGDSLDHLQIRTIAIAPYGIKGTTSSGGIYYDIANILAKEAGYSANNTIYPYARIMAELKSGQTDLTIMFKYKELRDHVIYVAPLPTLKNVVIGLNGISFDSISQLKGKKLAYLRGAKFSDAIDNDPEIYRQETTDFTQGLKMLMRGRVDAIIGPMDPILSAAARMNWSEALFGKPFIVSERTPWVQISKKSAKRISVEKLKSLYEDIEQRGELQRLRQKYIGGIATPLEVSD